MAKKTKVMKWDDKRIQRLLDRSGEYIHNLLCKITFDKYHLEEHITHHHMAMLFGDGYADFTYRVRVLDKKTVQFSQLDLTREKGEVNEIMPRSDLPQWADELLCVLSICDQGQVVPDVGMKLRDDVYYLYKGE